MGDQILNRRSSYFSGCITPPCVPVHDEYSRVNVTGQDKSRRNRKLRTIIRKIVSDNKCIYGQAKQITFQYDPVSYSRNFDDGDKDNESVRR